MRAPVTESCSNVKFNISGYDDIVIMPGDGMTTRPFIVAVNKHSTDCSLPFFFHLQIFYC